MLHTTDIEFCNPFDEEAPDFWMKIEHLARYIYSRKIIDEKNLNKILDVGCANGYGSIELANSLNNIIGVDFSNRLIELARINVKNSGKKNIDFLKCDLENQSLSSMVKDKVDFITCFETIEHLSNPEETIKEFYKVLDKNGILLISVPNEAFEPKNEDGSPRNPFHKQLFSRKDISNLIENAGFKIEKFLYQPFSNIFFNKENDMIDDGKYEKDFVNSLYNHKSEAIRYYAELFGLPQSNMEKESYSIIIKAEK